MAKGLSWFWTRLYDGVELHHVEQLQKVVDGNEVIYVPCHRSHIDYLLLSYVIYYKGYAIPHIAAGINLNMPIVGGFLRRGGAFFMRRTFKGSSLYTMVFMKYLGLMMARGHSIEYFIEGGRSRTGRLLQPKTGMLSMTLRSYLRDPGKPIVFLPVYFGYERLVEGKTYIGELSGKPKEKESVWGMLRTLPALRSRFGKVHVSFGEPIHLNSLLDAHAPGRTLEKEERPTWLMPVVDELATRIMTNINSAACVTPINLLALVLLATPKQSMLEGDLIRQLELYASILRQAPYSPQTWITEADGVSMMRHGERMGLIQRLKHPLGDVMRMTEENSVLMTYFRNNVLHLIAVPSLVACCFLNNRTMRTEDIQRLMWRIYPYVRDELFLRWSEAEVGAMVVESLEDLANHGLLESVEGGAMWRRPPTGSTEAVQLSVLAQITVQLIERYYLVIAVLLKSGSGRVSQEVLESQCHLMAQRMSLLYELDSPEFFDRALFKNFIDLLRARNVLGVNAEGRLTYTDMLPAVADDAQLVLHEQIRNSVLQVTHR
jgi:glycerol-3-phosphate O-acyltransferase